jgi:hypothetical protein
MVFKRFTRLVLLCAVILAAGSLAVPALAGQSVDPSTLNPPPPDFFNAVCSATGAGTICTLAFTQIEGPGGTGLICGSGPDSFEAVSQDVRTVDGRRFYDQDNNLTERHFREVYVGTFSNPLTGAYLNFTQANTIIHRLAVPGDVDSGKEQIDGSFRISLPGGGVVLTDAGATLLATDGSLLFSSSHHPFDDYFINGDTSALQAICDGLMR